jgi:hypothetical protein
MSAFTFSLAEMAKLSGIEDLGELLRNKKTVVIAYAVDDKGTQSAVAPCFQAHLNYEGSAGRRQTFSLAYNYRGESRAIVFEVDQRKMEKISIIGFNGKLDTSGGRWTQWLASALDLRSGELSHSREHMFSKLGRGHLGLAQAMLDGQGMDIIPKAAEIANRGRNAEGYSDIIEVARRVEANNNCPPDIREKFSQLANTMTKAGTDEDFRAAAVLYQKAESALLEKNQLELNEAKRKSAADATPSPAEVGQLKSASLVPLYPELYSSYAHLVCDTVKHVSDLSRINFVNALASGDLDKSLPILLLATTHVFKAREGQRAAAG